jgi:uncharacterized membrane protein YuzA (DUF378 family)
MKFTDLIVDLLSSTSGKGPSCIRLIYALNGIGAAVCASVATLAGMFVYCSPAHTANPVYWTGVAALWTATLGFSTNAKNIQTESRKQIVLAETRPAMAASGD